MPNMSKYAKKSDLVKFQSQITDSKKLVTRIATKVHQEEENREKWINERLNQEFSKLHLSKDVSTAIEQLDLLKNECKFELKRVMKQGYQVNDSYLKQIETVKAMSGRMSDLQSRQDLADASFGTVLKLARI
jgi:hypothetical protein